MDVVLLEMNTCVTLHRKHREALRAWLSSASAVVGERHETPFCQVQHTGAVGLKRRFLHPT